MREKERERAHEQGRGKERREGQRILSRLCADSRELDVGLKPTDCEIMTCTETTEPPGRPCMYILYALSPAPSIDFLKWI